jgi:hypothetical protein
MGAVSGATGAYAARPLQAPSRINVTGNYRSVVRFCIGGEGSPDPNPEATLAHEPRRTSTSPGLLFSYPVRAYFFVYGDRALRVATCLLSIPRSDYAFSKASHV